MQPIQDRGRGRVDRQGCGRDGEGGHGTPKVTLPTFIPPIFENSSYSLNLIFLMFSMFFQNKKNLREPKCSSYFSYYPSLWEYKIFFINRNLTGPYILLSKNRNQRGPYILFSIFSFDGAFLTDTRLKPLEAVGPV